MDTPINKKYLTVGDFLDVLNSPSFKNTGSRGIKAVYGFFTRHHEPTVHSIKEALGGPAFPTTPEEHEIAGKIVCALPIEILRDVGIFDPKSSVYKKISNCSPWTRKELKAALDKFVGDDLSPNEFNRVLRIRDTLNTIRCDLARVDKMLDELSITRKDLL